MADMTRKWITPTEFNHGALYLPLLTEFDELYLVSVAAPRAIDFLAIEDLEIYWRDPICLSFSVVVYDCGKNIGDL